ncbi:MAG: ABC transporter permease [Oscillospiraceae bacterium]|nr:ABC transporter permease [Oscillospiraceae bacterium]
MTKTSTVSKLYIALIFLFLYAPMIVMMVFSFNGTESTYVFSGFSLQWYERLFHDRATMNALKNTVVLAVVSAAVSTVMGTLAAVGIDSMKKKYLKTSVMTVTNIPMMNPEIVTGISMMLLFVFAGTMFGRRNVLGFWTILIAHVSFQLPYIILSVLPKLRQTDPRIYEAAQDLGCHPVKAFFKVVFPAILPGIVAGAIMAFTLSLDDFIISYFTNGPDFQTLPIQIFSMTKKRVKPDMYALSTLIFAAIFILLILMNFAQSKSDKKQRAKREAEK